MGRSRQPTVDRSGPPPTDQAIADLAERQHGTISLAQLNALGLSRQAVAKRVDAGRLHRIHRGVFAVGHARLTREGRWHAAVLACGPGAVLSHRDAAALWNLRPSARRRIDVSTIRRGRQGPAGVELHRVRRLDPVDVTVRDGIRVTTVSRTLVDLAEVVDRAAAAKALHEAEVLRLLDVASVADAVARANGRRRAHVVAELLAAAEPAVPTRSELEHRFLVACREADLPAPVANTRVESFEVDFLWPVHRLVVETDGASVHLTRRAFEADRARDVALTLAGYTVVRFTWRQLTERPGEVASALRRLLSAR